MTKYLPVSVLVLAVGGIILAAWAGLVWVAMLTVKILEIGVAAHG